MQQIDSTNTYAKELLAKTTPKNGTVILADEQLNGRGQGTNIWKSEARKNITASIIYFPDKLLAINHFMLNMKVALAVVATLKQYLNNQLIQIKWPNDIYVDEKKIAGILIENTISGQFITKSVIGIGLNVNQTHFLDLTLATSMQIVEKTSFDLNTVLQTLLVHIENWYMSDYSKPELQKKYEFNLYLKNITHSFMYKESIINGKIIGVNEHGQLLIETTNGIEAFNQREISFGLSR